MKIAIIGDTIIDEYYYCKSIKDNPETDGKVFIREKLEPNFINYGGAANIYKQIKILNPSDYYSIINKININSCCIKADCHLPIKIRHLYENKVVSRIDVEQKNFGLENIGKFQNYLFESLQKKKYDVFVFSDYDKGMFSENIFNLKKLKGLKLVDPKKDPKKWIGCNVLKLNYKEAFELSNYKDWKDQCKYFYELLECETVIITHSGDGYKIKHKDNYVNFVDEEKIVPKNVIAGGDIFIAFLALYSNLNMLEAANLAYIFAKSYVKKGEFLTKEEVNEIYENC